MIEGLDRWLGDIASSLGELASQSPATRFRRAAEVIEASRQRHAGLVLALFDGLLFQVLLDPALAIEGARMERAQARLRTLLPERLV